MSGGNYFISVRQILESEKCICLQSIIRLSSFNFHDTEVYFGEPMSSLEIEIDSEQLINQMSGTSIDISDSADQVSVIYYIAGYFSRRINQQSDCAACRGLIANSDMQPRVEFHEDASLNKDALRFRTQLLDQVNRGGLCQPSDMMFLTCLHVYLIYEEILKNEKSKEMLLSFKEPRNVFVQTIISKFEYGEETLPIYNQKSSVGHAFKKFIAKAAYITFNAMSQNFVSDQNRIIHQSKHRRVTKAKFDQNKSSCPDKQKIMKLMSN